MHKDTIYIKNANNVWKRQTSSYTQLLYIAWIQLIFSFELKKYETLILVLL